MSDTPVSAHATGARHPITAGADTAWNITGRDDSDDLWGWMAALTHTGEVYVILQGPDGEVSIPRSHLAIVGRALIAAHVDAARPDRWPRA